MAEIEKEFKDISKANTPERVKRIEKFTAKIGFPDTAVDAHLAIEFSEPVVMSAQTFNRINSTLSKMAGQKPDWLKVSITCTRMMRTLLMYGYAFFEDENEAEVSVFVDDDEMLKYEDNVFEILEKQYA